MASISIDMKDAYWHIPIYPVFTYIQIQSSIIWLKYSAEDFHKNVTAHSFTIVFPGNEHSFLSGRRMIRHNFEDMLDLPKSHLIFTRQLSWIGLHWNSRSQTVSLRREPMLEGFPIHSRKINVPKTVGEFTRSPKICSRIN